MKNIIISIFASSLLISSCAETADFLAASLPKDEKSVKCMKLGTARQVVNSKGETCNKW